MEDESFVNNVIPERSPCVSNIQVSSSGRVAFFVALRLEAAGVQTFSFEKIHIAAFANKPLPKKLS